MALIVRCLPLVIDAPFIAVSVIFFAASVTKAWFWGAAVIFFAARKLLLVSP